MLQKEFEERIGRSVSEEEFIEVNAMYMAAGEIDKDVFCREWKQIGESPLVKGLFETSYNLNQALQEHKLMLNETQEMLSDAADAIIEQSEECITFGVPHVAEELDKKAAWLVGRKEVALRKTKGGFTFTDADREYIINNLTK